MSRIHQIANEMGADNSFTAECSLCDILDTFYGYNGLKAARSAFDDGWRYADSVKTILDNGSSVVIEGIVCPDCSKGIDFSNKVKNYENR